MVRWVGGCLDGWMGTRMVVCLFACLGGWFGNRETGWLGRCKGGKEGGQVCEWVGPGVVSVSTGQSNELQQRFRAESSARFVRQWVEPQLLSGWGDVCECVDGCACVCVRRAK